MDLSLMVSEFTKSREPVGMGTGLDWTREGFFFGMVSNMLVQSPSVEKWFKAYLALVLQC